uniref:Uncharacterized protein n=1 Tax=Oryza sativa subsp. japonica TaxID=39947 RepID=Q8H2S3_ORYSJ|nr:hypothetical protein [Oryza sativa Japonica Group]
MHGNGDVGKRSTAPALSVDWPVMAVRLGGVTSQLTLVIDPSRRRQDNGSGAKLRATAAQSHGDGGGGVPRAPTEKRKEPA